MRSILPVFLLTIGLLVAGCDSSSSDSSSATVSLTIAPVSASAQMAALGKSTGVVVEITSVKVLLRTIQFHHRADDDSLSFRTEPVVAELNLDGTPTVLAVAEVPEGAYHKVSFRVHKPEASETLIDPDFRIGTSGNERFSVIVEGFVDGEAFLYRSTKTMQQKLTFEEDLVIDADSAPSLSIPLTIDLATWFIGRDGSVLDPRTANANLIDDPIRESFKAGRPH